LFNKRLIKTNAVPIKVSIPMGSCMMRLEKAKPKMGLKNNQ
jgi:hypothetical protein